MVADHNITLVVNEGKQPGMTAAVKGFFFDQEALKGGTGEL